MSARRGQLLGQLEDEVGVLVRRVRRVLVERSRAVHPDLAPGAYLLLSYVDAEGPVRSSAVAEVLAMDKAAVSRTVQHLVDIGLLERSADPEDGRAQLLAVSADGRTRMREVSRSRSALLRGRLGEWSEDELAELVGSLARYNASLEDPWSG